MRIGRIFDYIGNFIVIVFILIILYGVFKGGLNVLTPSSAEFLTEISFILVGLTFFVLFEKSADSYKYYIAQACNAFSVSGFAFLAYMTVPYLEPNSFISRGLISVIDPLGFFGMLAFCIGLGILLITISIKTNNMQYPQKK